MNLLTGSEGQNPQVHGIILTGQCWLYMYASSTGRTPTLPESCADVSGFIDHGPMQVLSTCQQLLCDGRSDEETRAWRTAKDMRNCTSDPRKHLLGVMHLCTTLVVNCPTPHFCTVARATINV